MKEYKNKLDEQYINLLKEVYNNGYDSEDRTGTGTRKSFGHSIKVNVQEGFPILTSKKVFTKGIIYELLWFLSGDRNMKLMVNNKVNIWIGDAYKKYKKIAGSIEEPDYFLHVDDPKENRIRLLTEPEFIEKLKTDEAFSNMFGDLGRVYGVQWRNWRKVNNDGSIEHIDQIQKLLNTLETNPDDRRMIVTAWNPGELDDMLLPPCHNMFQVFTRKLSFNERIRYNDYKPYNLESEFPELEIDQKTFEDYHHKKMDEMGCSTRAISLSFNMRSVDVPLGMPFDISSYGFLLHMIAQQVNMIPENLVCNFADTHIYQNQFDGVKEQIERNTHKLPTLKLNKAKSLFDYKYEDFELIDYVCEDKIFYPLSN